MPTPRKHANAAERQAAYRQRLAQRPAAGLPGARQSGPPPGPGGSRWRRLLAEALQRVRTVEQEMEAVYERRSERWQGSERGDAFSGHLEAVRETLASLEEVAAEVPG